MKRNLMTDKTFRQIEKNMPHLAHRLVILSSVKKSRTKSPIWLLVGVILVQVFNNLNSAMTGFLGNPFERALFFQTKLFRVNVVG